MANQLLGGEPSASPKTPPPTPVRSLGFGDVSDGINAVNTGLVRSMFALPGLLVDTAANVRDLGKAAIGTAESALTGRPPSEMWTLGDRADDIGSTQWILRQMRRTPFTRALIDPQNPAYEGGYLQNAGAALAGIGRPSTVGEAAARAANSVVAATAAKAVGDATGSPALAIAAGMLPIGPALAEGAKRAIRPGAQNGPAAVVKRIVGGGEAEREAMVQRIEELRRSGVDNPTLGLATGNTLIGSMENWLQDKPGAIGILRKARNDALTGLKDTADRAADLASRNRGPDAAGAATQSGIRQFQDNLKARQEALEGRLDNLVPGQTPVTVDATQRTLAALNATSRGAPGLTGEFTNPKLQAIERGLLSDLERSTSAFSGIGLAPRAGSTLPYEAMKMSRTRVGNAVDDPSLGSGVSGTQWTTLHDALSQDLRTAGPRVEQVLDRAQALSEAGKARMDLLAPFARAQNPEEVFQRLYRVAGDSPTTFQAVKKSLPEGARGDVAGTMIDTLGRGAPGPQSGTGAAWSHETFLDNWNRLAPKARDGLLSGFPNAPQVKSDLEAVAQTANRMRGNSKMWANPAGAAADAAANEALQTVGSGGLGALLGRVDPKIPLLAARPILAANIAARGLTSQYLVDAVARRTTIDPRMLEAQAQGLMGTGLLSQLQPEGDYGGLLSAPYSAP